MDSDNLKTKERDLLKAWAEARDRKHVQVAAQLWQQLLDVRGQIAQLARR